MFKVCSSSSSSSSDDELVREAYIIAQDFVEQNLKSPSSAHFTGEYSYSKLDENEYLIKSQVDAENSFGAKIRSDWQVKLKYKSGD